jgi:hypothetical protein
MASVPKSGRGFTPAVAIDSHTNGLIADSSGNWLQCTVDASANIPSAKPGFAVGCLMVDLTAADAAAIYRNSGSVTSCTFTTAVTFS